MWQKLRSNFLKFSFYAFLVSLPLGTRHLLFLMAPEIGEYGSAFLYLSDIFMVLFLASFFFKRLPIIVQKPFFLRLFIFLALISIIFSLSKPLAIYSFVRLILLALLAFLTANSLKNNFLKLESILVVLAGSAVFQSLVGFLQFWKQRNLGLKILGESILGSEIPGVAKVVVNGAKIVRAYGTLPHPNVLAAFLLLGLCALYYFWLNASRRPTTEGSLGLHRPAEWKLFSSWKNFGSDLLIGLGIFTVILGLLLTFSRSAWLIAGLATLLVIGYSFKTKNYFRQSVRLGILTIAILAILILNFHQYIFPRIRISAQEPSVSYRLDYNTLGFYLILTDPLGIGIGNQILYSVGNDLYTKFGLDQIWQRQPIHNIYLLMASEIGILGLIAFLMFLAKILFSSKNFIVAVMLSSLLLFGLVDHFLWTLQPGRLMLWLVIGILMGTSIPVLAPTRVVRQNALVREANPRP